MILGNRGTWHGNHYIYHHERSPELISNNQPYILQPCTDLERAEDARMTHASVAAHQSKVATKSIQMPQNLTNAAKELTRTPKWPQNRTKKRFNNKHNYSNNYNKTVDLVQKLGRRATETTEKPPTCSSSCQSLCKAELTRSRFRIRSQPAG